MAWNEGQKVVSRKALSTMAGMQYRIVELATSEPNAVDYAAGSQGYGILMNEPRANEAASVAIAGEVPCYAALAISIGDYITSAVSATGGPGWATKVVSGHAATGLTILGQALSAASSGSVFTIGLNRQRVFGVSSAGLVTT
jgi:hypothetical protein